MGGEVSDDVKDDLYERFVKEARETGGSFKAIITVGQKPMAV
jgi:hypothetical protein